MMITGMEGSPRGRGEVAAFGGFFAILSISVVLAGCGGDGEIEQPVPLYGQVPIEYPVELWDEGVEGKTVVRVRVTSTGAVDSVEVFETSGHPRLDSAAVLGARDLRFQPGRRDGKRVDVWATVPVEFSRKPQTQE